MTQSGSPPYAYFSGTSMATPYASAAAALVRSALPARSMSDIAWALRASAVDVVDPGLDTCSGSGLVDALAAEAYLIAHPTGPGPAAPQFTGALSGRGMVRLAFRVPAGVDEVRVYRDDVLVATVAGTARSYVDRSPGATVRSYAIGSVAGTTEGPRSPVRTAQAR